MDQRLTEKSEYLKIMMDKDKSTLLVIDDQNVTREAMLYLLKAEGYHVIAADSGQTGFDLTKKYRPDLVLLDVVMPDIDGFEVCRKIRHDPEIQDIPVLLVTALDTAEHKLRSIEAGADDFIAKPVEKRELFARVKAITQLNRYRRLLAERIKFEWVVDNSNDGYVLLNAEQNITYANTRARQCLNLPDVAQLNGPLNFIRQAQKQYSLEPQEAWRTWPTPLPKNPRYLIRAETNRAKSAWFEIDSCVLPESQTVYLVRMNDISSQVTLQQHISAFQVLVSHKLRTPLTGINALSLLKRQIKDKLTTNEIELFNIIEKSAERIHHQIIDILDYIHISGLLDVGSGLELSQLILVVNELMLELEVGIDVHLPENKKNYFLSISREGLKAVLRQLFDNSRKFHPRQKPSVQLDVRLEKEHKILLRITDNGVHLSAEALRQVWTPYYQSEKNVTGEIDGMGLGLPSVASLIWSVGGTCHIFNRNDSLGIVVELRIPQYKMAS